MSLISTFSVILTALVISRSAIAYNVSLSNGKFGQNNIPKKSDSDKGEHDNKKKASLMNNSNSPNFTSFFIGFIDILSVRLLEYKKPLDFSKVPGVSADCQRDFSRFLAALKKFELWALKSK